MVRWGLCRGGDGDSCGIGDDSNSSGRDDTPRSWHSLIVHVIVREQAAREREQRERVKREVRL